MYKFDRYHQYSLSDFNQPLGMEMNPENRWVKKAAMIPWDEIVERGFSLAKRCFGMGLITTKLDITTRSSIALSILAMNLSNLDRTFLLAIFYPIILLRCRDNKKFQIA